MEPGKPAGRLMASVSSRLRVALGLLVALATVIVPWTAPPFAHASPGSFAEWDVPTDMSAIGSGGGEIVAGSDGALWFTEGNPVNVGRITADGTISEFPLPNESYPSLVQQPGGPLWVFTPAPTGTEQA